MVDLFLIVGLSYVVGSVPLAWVVTRAVSGRDIRLLGTGNIGVMNVALNVSRWSGLLVLAGELAKGFAAVWVGRALGTNEWSVGIALTAAVVGTRWSVWMGFKGGRGNTTGAAGLLLISWQSVAFGLGLWFVFRWVLRSSFRATRAALLAAPIVLWLFTSWVYLTIGALLSAVYLTTHSTKTDDHLLLKQRWPSLWAFVRGSPRSLETQRPKDRSERHHPASSQPS